MKNSKKLLSGLILGKAGWLLVTAAVLLITSCGKSELSVTTGDTVVAAEEKVESGAGPDAGSDKDSGTGSDIDSGTEKGQKSDEDSDIGPEIDSGTKEGHKSDEDSDIGPEIDSDTEEGRKSDEKSDIDGMVFVYICGAVTKEGVYSLPNGSRVQDALDRAGGYSEDAEKGYINLARVLTDGEKIYFPTMDEAGNLSVSEKMENQKYTNQDVYGNINIGDGSGNPNGAIDDESDTFSDKRVNINTARKEELMTLSGIGESKAEDIISYRERVGEFSSIEDIKNVSGIGDNTFDRIKESITVH